MALTKIQCYWIMLTALTITTSLSYSVPTLHTLMLNVMLILLMLLCTAVSNMYYFSYNKRLLLQTQLEFGTVILILV